MSSNVNPLGPPAGLIAYLCDRMTDIVCLPDPDALHIRRSFAKRHGLAPGHVVAGNGTTQLIYALPPALGLGRVLVLGPAYADYAQACAMHNVPCDFLLADEAGGFRHDAGVIARKIREAKPDAVFVCNPSNPTGVLMDRQVILDLCNESPDVLFVIDESYLPFVREGESLSLINGPGMDNLLVLSSMSKIFRVPGLRIGFAAGPEPVVDLLARHLPCWSVNTLAQAAVDWILEHKREVNRFIDDAVTLVEEERSFLLQRLAASGVVSLFPSVASFMLGVLHSGFTSASVCDALAQGRILIRDCANFEGLSDRHIRISLKTREHNSLLVDRLFNLCPSSL
ncbi:pyridoxal phosphate-dependent aminotransferase [Desulfosudis oleivorans]|uniref:Aminotransferase class I and II n=1 Tax=Desulfosudis oleivorans (strain DSM 6200 / JCM 39069 / Hxd3) TaxID=96561 RepID=A8ZY30_DESOH|nr:aminotransferase class I/II-fold pyridoxal phosphate-dependent enzyme [Desulfosudis oleivorans]ABW67037.1 aminotransferase class I and II [Desulfosudis oleivorans Hxd3]